MPRRLLSAATALLMFLSIAVAFSSPAEAISTPPTLQVVFNASLATARWGAVSGATKYIVDVGKVGYYGPWLPYTTTSTSINISYIDFPYRNEPGTAYIFQVLAVDGHGNESPTNTLKFKTISQGGGVSTKNKLAAAKKANSCLKKGLAAGGTTAPVGGSVLAASVWLPGLGEVTAVMVAVSTVAAGGSEYVSCLVP